MLNWMRHTSLLLLGCVLAITGCGGGPSDTEIEATVEVRVADERSIEATVEARAQPMAITMVEATAQTAPTATPTTTSTPMPTPTPAPIPSGHQITIHLTTSTVHYKVTGKTTREIFDSLKANGPDNQDVKPGWFTAGLTEREGSFEYNFLNHGNHCELQSTDITQKLVVTLPVHSNPLALGALQLYRWQKHVEGIAVHEQHHVDIYIQGVEAFKKRLETFPEKFSDCDALKSSVQSAWDLQETLVEKEQEAFHLSEEHLSQSLRDPVRMQIDKNKSELDQLQGELDSISLQRDALMLKIKDVKLRAYPHEVQIEDIKVQMEDIKAKYPDLKLPQAVFDKYNELSDEYDELRAKWNELNDLHNKFVTNVNGLAELHNKTVTKFNELTKRTNTLSEKLAWLP